MTPTQAYVSGGMLTPTQAYVAGGMSPELRDEEALDQEVQWLLGHGQHEQAAMMIRGWVVHRKDPSKL